MATPTDEQNRIDKRYERGLGAYESAGVDQAEAFANDPKNHTDLANAEATPNRTNSGWNTNFSSEKKGSSAGRAKAFFKKKGSIIGIVSLLGLGGIGAGIFGSNSIFTSLMQNLTGINDSTSRSMNIRTRPMLTRLLSNPGDNGGLCKAKMTIKCKGGRISNKGLQKLAKKGIVPLDAKGNKIDIKGRGYPKGGNPASYEVGDAKTRVPAKQLGTHLASTDRKLGNKVFGRTGILNMRTKAFAGRQMTKFRTAFNLKRDGGPLKGDNKTGDKTERKKNARSNFKKSASSDNLDGTKEKIKKRAKGKFGRAKLGGAAYTAAYGTCLLTKIPSLVGGGVAAVQLARLMPVAMNFILSPAAKVTASGVDSGNDVDPVDMETAASLLTDTSKDSNGNMKSALDSPLLMSAIGVNKGKIDPNAYSDYIPGYNIISNDAFKTARAIQKGSAPTCAVIMNPITMYTAMAVTTAISVSTGGIGALVNLGAGFVIGYGISKGIEKLVSWGMGVAIEALAGKDIMGDLQGIELGNALGGSAIAMFSAMGMARHLPTVPVNGLASFKNVIENDIAVERDYDIAALSPFDISSPYTFLGSMVHSLRLRAISTGSHSGPMSIIRSVAQLPVMALTPHAMASEGFNEGMCDYAETFDMKPDDGPTPAINIMGLPCTGFTEEQASLSPEEAENTLIDIGWIDTKKEVPDNATTEDLLDKGIIKKDTPLAAYVESCSDASTGDYLFEGAGCVTPESVVAGTATGTGGEVLCEDTKDDDGEPTRDCSALDGIREDTSRKNDGQDETKAYQAMSVWLLDFQVGQEINGEYDEETSANNSSTTGDYMSDDFIVYNQCGATSDGEKAWDVSAVSRACVVTCVNTSVAIIMANMADSNITPADTWKYSAAHTTSVGGTPDPYVEKLASDNGMRAERIGSTKDIAKYKEVFDNGGLILLLGSGPAPFISPGAHAVVARGITKDGKIRISNPNQFDHSHYGAPGMHVTVDADFNELMANSSLLEQTWAFYKD